MAATFKASYTTRRGTIGFVHETDVTTFFAGSQVPMSTPCQRAYVILLRPITADADEFHPVSGMKICKSKGLPAMRLILLIYRNSR
jgi:hypothetical protein